jgi:D-tyrosyl-tRNA(Tyr) deacylase
MKSILLTFCTNLNHDPVSARVLERVLANGQFKTTALSIDGQPVLASRSDDMVLYLMRIEMVLSHAYERYAPFINQYFTDVDAVVIINWHEGAKAPDAIFTVQTSGDMKSGCFSPVDPRVVRGLYLAIESARVEAGLDTFTTWMEATHWSGVIYGEQPGSHVELIKPSVIDVEIGSRPEDWSNQAAVDVMAHALPHMLDSWETPVNSVFCIGGMHFEPSFTDPVREYGAKHGIAISHILPNHWLVSEGYDRPERFEDLLNCVKSIKGGTHTIVFHDNLKGSYKDQARRLGETLKVPVMSHKRFRNTLLEMAAAAPAD